MREKTLSFSVPCSAISVEVAIYYAQHIKAPDLLSHWLSYAWPQNLHRIILCKNFMEDFLHGCPGGSKSILRRLTVLTAFVWLGNFDIVISEWVPEELGKKTRDFSLRTPLDFVPQAVLRLVNAKAASSNTTQVSQIFDDGRLHIEQKTETKGVPLSTHIHVGQEYTCQIVGENYEFSVKVLS